MNRIELEGIGKRYGRNWALRGVNASFAQGETIMVAGPNGSGKTTMIKCLLGLVRATEGAIRVNGQEVGADPSYRSAIGYMPQLAEFPKELTVDQLLRMMNDIRDARSGSTDDRLINALGVDLLLDKRISALSGGMRQKVSAVLAFRYKPSVLVLDEPTAGLDPVSARKVMDAVSEACRHGATAIITSHILEEVERHADRLAYLEDGRLRFLLAPETIKEVTDQRSLVMALPLYLSRIPNSHVESM